MKKLIAILLFVATSAFCQGVKISDLPQIITPSTNSFFEIADMGASPKSRKIVITDLSTALLNFSGLTNLTISGTGPISVTQSGGAVNVGVSNATAAANGVVRADGTTILNDGTGKLSAVAGGAGTVTSVAITGPQ